MNEMIILRERVITIGAGDTFDQSLQGNVLRVTAGNVPLRVQDRDQQMDFTLLAGERAEFPGEFPGLILSHNSGVDQTFTIQVGKGVNVASALVSGSVSITGTPTVINGGGNLTSITNPVKAQDDGYAYGANFASIANTVANTPVTILSPASNTNGVILHRAAFVLGLSSALCRGAFLAKSSAPASLADGDSVLTADNLIFVGSWFYFSGKLEKAVKIPAGKGVYFISEAASTIAHFSAAYSLL